MDNSNERHPAENTLAISPEIDPGEAAPIDTIDGIPLAVNELDRPRLRRFVDDDPHGLKSKGQGDLSKVTSFPNPDAEFQEYPKHIIKDGKTYSVAAEDAEPVLIAQPAGDGTITSDGTFVPAE